MNDKILEMKNMYKAYPGVVALNDVSFQVKKGEVHAIVGENGAGKSTLIKVLSGAETADSGSIVLNGIAYSKLSPLEAIEKGVHVIYQELNLASNLSVSENIFLGHELMTGFFIDNKIIEKKTQDMLNALNLGIDPNTLVKDLTVAYQQMVEVVKAISHDVKILVMDEPTSPLSNSEVEVLFDLINSLKNKGISIIYISHRMEEIFSISDRVTVMMDGKTVITLNTKDTNRQELIKHMVGRELNEVYPESEFKSDEEILVLENASNKNLNNINLKLRKGETLGIGGLVGSGRTELARMIFGADPIYEGEIMLDGEGINVKNPSDAIVNGIGLIPEDRKNEGLILSMSVKHNISLTDLTNICRNYFLSDKSDMKLCNSFVEKLNIKVSDNDFLVRKLSGGNQQKVVLAKWLATKCKVLLFDEPTRGIDVGAKMEIYNLMRKLTLDGISIIMISSDMTELLGMSDRIVVMSNREIKACLNREEFSQNTILEFASGGENKNVQ